MLHSIPFYLSELFFKRHKFFSSEKIYSIVRKIPPKADQAILLTKAFKK